MSDSRQRIRETALAMFNERGYDAVSLRDIAREAGVAIGTLTYHYKRKEDLLDDLLSDLHYDFETALDDEPRGEDLLSHLLRLVEMNEANHARYPFYFENPAQVVHCSPTLAEEERRFEQLLVDYYLKSLRRLREEGVVRTDVTDLQLGALSLSMATLQATWSVSGAPHSSGIEPRLSVSQALKALLAAFLSDECRDAAAM